MPGRAWPETGGRGGAVDPQSRKKATQLDPILDKLERLAAEKIAKTRKPK